jgi:hypothetical protein
MTKISQYPEITTPDVDDLLVGTDVENSNATKNFTIQSIVDLVSAEAGITPTLQQVTDEGNTTTNDIELVDNAEVIFGTGGGILLDNTSRLREGTIDAGLGGSKGISQICSVGYELKWEAGRLYVMNGNGNGIRQSLYNFNIVPTLDDDNTKAYYQGSLWSLDNGDVYECSDATTGAAVWELKIPTAPYKVYTALLSQSGISAPTLVVLQNTLGDTITPLYNSVGNYTLQLDALNLFTSTKTFILLNSSYNANAYLGIVRGDDSQLLVNATFNGSNSNNVILNASIEIRVYE